LCGWTRSRGKRASRDGIFDRLGDRDATVRKGDEENSAAGLAKWIKVGKQFALSLPEKKAKRSAKKTKTFERVSSMRRLRYLFSAPQFTIPCPAKAGFMGCRGFWQGKDIEKAVIF
jgi:hypothetical protein